MADFRADITFLGKYFSPVQDGRSPSEIPAEKLPDILRQNYNGRPILFAVAAEENSDKLKTVLEEVSTLFKNGLIDEDKLSNFFNLRDANKNTILINNAESGRESTVGVIMDSVYNLLKNKKIAKKTFLNIVNANNECGASAASIACEKGNVGSLGNVLEITAEAYVNLYLNEDDYRTIYDRVSIDEAIVNRKRLIREKEDFATNKLLPARQTILKKNKQANNIIDKRELLKKLMTGNNM